MQTLTNTRGTLRTMQVGDRYRVPFTQMAPEYVRAEASRLKRQGHGVFRVSVDRTSKISTVTRTA